MLSLIFSIFAYVLTIVDPVLVLALVMFVLVMFVLVLVLVLVSSLAPLALLPSVWVLLFFLVFPRCSSSLLSYTNTYYIVCSSLVPVYIVSVIFLAPSAAAAACLGEEGRADGRTGRTTL